MISDFSFVPRCISSNKACHGHDVAAEKTDKSFRNRVLFDAVSIGCNCCVGLKPRSGKHSHSLKKHVCNAKACHSIKEPLGYYNHISVFCSLFSAFNCSTILTRNVTRVFQRRGKDNCMILYLKTTNACVPCKEQLSSHSLPLLSYTHPKAKRDKP